MLNSKDIKLIESHLKNMKPVKKVAKKPMEVKKNDKKSNTAKKIAAAIATGIVLGVLNKAYSKRKVSKYQKKDAKIKDLIGKTKESLTVPEKNQVWTDLDMNDPWK